MLYIYKNCKRGLLPYALASYLLFESTLIQIQSYLFITSQHQVSFHFLISKESSHMVLYLLFSFQMGSTIFKAHMAPNINFKIAAKMAAMYLIT